MIDNEKKVLRIMDWGIYLIFVPVICVLIPTSKIIEKDPYFFFLMMLYMVLIHFVNRRYNFVTYLFRHKYKKAIFVALLIAVLTYIFSLIRVNDLREADDYLPVEMVTKVRHQVLYILCFIDLSLTVMLSLLIELFRHKIERQDIEAEKGKAELAMYKSQINPHFMFNTLNTIYTLNFTGSDKTGKVIMKFSNIVKYIYQNTDKEMIMVCEEVEYLQELIDLHSLRLSELTRVNFVIDIDDNSQYIPSMIFITFVENLFKYGVSSVESSDIEIYLQLKNKKLTFTTQNTIFSSSEDSTGIGIENCRKRLSLLYPSRYTLDCHEEGNIYKTTLNIEL
ncbi:MAG: histidine kinase [Rikenellaceae bacterium]